jgi:large subunit ribosomal protein L17
MRHRISGRKLRRNVSHKKATLNSLATELLRHKKITTTLAKAKETRRFVEPLITRAKTDSVHNRRLVARYIKDKEVHKELFNEIGPAVEDRQGGYTRVVKLGIRRGDSADMAILELVDYGEVSEKEAPKKEKQKEEPEEESQVQDAEVVEEVKETEEVEEEEDTQKAEAETKTKEEAKTEESEDVKDEEKAEDDKEESDDKKKDDK